MRVLGITARGEIPAMVEVDDPQPALGQVRVAVEAASVNGFDLAVAAGYVWDHMPHTFPVVLGRDFAGTVESVAPGVQDLRVGDRVAGAITALELGDGPIGEYLVVDASALTAVPESVSSVQAAAVGLAGVTARDLIDALSIAADDSVLVSGATGGVGVFALQLAARRGARVLATARPGKATEFVRALGATDVIDYSGDVPHEVLRIAPDGVTKVVHTAGDASALAGALSPGGQLASTVGATSEQIGRSDVSVTAVMGTYTPKKLRDLLQQVATAELNVPVTTTHPLAEATRALEEFGKGKLGKIMVTVP